MVQNLRLADRKFVTFPAHIFNKDRQMKFAAAGNLKALGRVCVFHPETYVRIQFPVETVAEMTGSDIFSFLSGKRTVVYHKVHGNCGLGDFLERNSLRIVAAAEGVSDMDVRNTGNRHDGTYGSFLYLYFV